MAKNKMTVKVYLEYANYWGQITDSAMIAQFMNDNYAEIFIDYINQDLNNRVERGKSGWKLRVERV